MSTKVLDCCLQKNLTPILHRRQQLLHTRCLPKQTEVRKKLGDDLANVIFHTMNPIEKHLMGVEEPLNGPPEQLWIAPNDRLEGHVNLTAPPNDEVLRALTHEKILELGSDMENRLAEHEQYKIEIAVKKAVDFERFEFKLKSNFMLKQQEKKHCVAMKELELTLLSQQEEREKCLKKMYEEGREFLAECLLSKCDIETKKIVKNAVQRTRERLCKVYEKRFCNALCDRIEVLKCEIEEEYKKKGLVNPTCIEKSVRKEVEKELRETFKKEKEVIEAQHVAEIMHVICAEKTAAQQKLKLKETAQHLKQFSKLECLLEKLYSHANQNADSCILFEEIFDELNVIKNTEYVTETSESTLSATASKTVKSDYDIQSLNQISGEKFPPPIQWHSETPSTSSSTMIEDFNVLPDLTAIVPLKAIISHARHNSKFLNEANQKGKKWELLALKKSTESLISYLLNGQNLMTCLEKILAAEKCPNAEFPEKCSLISCVCSTKLVQTKDSIDLIPLPHVPTIEPIATSHIITARDSLEVIHNSSFRTDTEVNSSPSTCDDYRTINLETTTSHNSAHYNHNNEHDSSFDDGGARIDVRGKTNYICHKAKSPKYFRKQPFKQTSTSKHVPTSYNKCTESDIDEIYEEHQQKNLSLLKQKHGIITRKKIVDSHHSILKHRTKNNETEISEGFSLQDKHRAQRLVHMPVLNVLDMIIDDKAAMEFLAKNKKK